MTDELKKYLLEQCRDWMLPEELKALTRIGLTKHGEEIERKIAFTNFKFEAMYGFTDDKTNELVELGRDGMEMEIANRLLTRSKNELLNSCPQCGRLARTPKAKQCRHCGHNWHNR